MTKVKSTNAKATAPAKPSTAVSIELLQKAQARSERLSAGKKYYFLTGDFHHEEKTSAKGSKYLSITLEMTDEDGEETGKKLQLLFDNVLLIVGGTIEQKAGILGEMNKEGDLQVYQNVVFVLVTKADPNAAGYAVIDTAASIEATIAMYP